MYTILITDDEPTTVESVAQILKRNFGRTITVHPCFSGREAIEKSAKIRPDIVSMDIRMDGINGLEAIRGIKRISPETECIILSACDYFEYVQEAMSLGVAEYLVKPVDEEKLCATVRKLMQRIDHKLQEKQLYLKQHEQLMMSIPVLEASFCYALTSPEDNAAHLESIYTLIGPQNEGGYVMLMHPNWDHFSEERRTAFYEDFRYHLKRSCDCIVAMVKDRVIAYICDRKKAPERAEMERIVASLETMHKKNTPTLIGIGRYYERTADAQRSYLEANCAVKVLRGKESKESAILRFDDSAEAQKLYQLLAPNMRIGLALAENTQTHNYPSHIIQKAEEYIAQHYTEPIRLEDVAEAVNLSKYYFSRFFKEKKGVSFTEYVTRVRVDYAQKLLRSTQLSVKEIAYQAGFRDPNYFSKVFKRHTGVNPSEFRNSSA